MKKIIRTLCFILSAVCIVLNIGPVITNAQVNIGIIAGLLTAAILFDYGIKADKINSAISVIWKKKAGKAIIIAASLCIAAGIGIGRIAEGWTFGEEKNADKKTTPLLIPYDELPESEKEYDRNTALATLKLIIKLGYSISPNY